MSKPRNAFAVCSPPLARASDTARAELRASAFGRGLHSSCARPARQLFQIWAPYRELYRSAARFADSTGRIFNPARPLFKSRHARYVPAHAHVLLGMGTFERQDYVKLAFLSLQASSHQADLLVVDDGSTTFTLQYLRDWSVGAVRHVEVRSTPSKLRADGVMAYIMHHFLKEPSVPQHDVLVYLDSDLVVATDWWPRLQDKLLMAALPRPMITSLYRSNGHGRKGNIVPCHQYLTLSMGGAGLLAGPSAR